MPAEMFLENSLSGLKYTFADIPLFGKSVDYTRLTQQGASRKTIAITLSGFFAGNEHTEIMSQYMDLVAVLDTGYLRLYYHDGNSVIIDRSVYVQSYTEPADWKEYDGNYNINLSYPDDNTFEHDELNLQATYQASGVTYIFDPIPAYSKSRSPMRSDPYDLDYVGDLRIADQSTITLNGFLHADTPAALKLKMDELESAFSHDGTLNYLGWSFPVRRGSLQWNSDTPINYAVYSINFFHRDTALYEIKVSRSNPRLHPFLEVTDRPYCGSPHIKYFPTYQSGQDVTYTVNVKAETVEAAITIIKAELTRIVTPGGIEKSGGTQRTSERENSASVTLTHYYPTPIILNW